MLVRGLGAALGGRRGVSKASVEDFAQEALVKIVRNLDSFRGESRFTTWAQKIAVRVALTELRHKRWRDVSLQEMSAGEEGTDNWLGKLTDLLPTPEELTTREAMLKTVERLISEGLTDRQRRALVAVKINEMPIEEVARRMGTNRNAVYKLLHDARKRLKQRLSDEGLSLKDVLAVFDDG